MPQARHARRRSPKDPGERVMELMDQLVSILTGGVDAGTALAALLPLVFHAAMEAGFSKDDLSQLVGDGFDNYAEVKRKREGK